MTKEALEKEAKEWKDKADLWCKTANLKDHNIMINKELEQENAELKQEAEAEADKVIIGSGMDRTSVIHLKHLLVTMYIQGAEPREKRIAELETENKVLAQNLEDTEIVNKALEKENAELKKKLKEELKTIADKDLSFVARFDALGRENAELKSENQN